MSIETVSLNSSSTETESEDEDKEKKEREEMRLMATKVLEEDHVARVSKKKE